MSSSPSSRSPRASPSKELNLKIRIEKKQSSFDSLYKSLFMSSLPKIPCNNTVNCPPAILYATSEENKFVLETDLSEDNSTFYCNFDDEATFIYDLTHARSLKHDFTFGFIQKDFDKPMHTIMRLGDGTDDLTPDLIIEHGNKEFTVVEFTTCATSDERVMTGALNVKINKYMPPLLSRADKGVKISYCVFVVSKSSILTNADLSTDDHLLPYICSRYKATETMMSFLNLHGICIHSEGEISSLSKIQNTFEILSSQGVSFNEDMCFNKKLWDNRFNLEPNFEVKLRNQCKEEIKNVLTSQPEKPPNPFHEIMIEEEKWEELWKNNDVEDVRWDQKHVINVPYLLVDDNLPDWKGTFISSSLDVPYFLEGDTAESRFLHKVIQNIRNDNYYYHEDEEREGQIAMGLIAVPDKDERSKAKQMNVKISMPDEIELAKVGWNGKKHRMKVDVINYRNEKKLCFAQNTDVDDIDMYVEDTSQHLPDQVPFTDERMKLIISAWENHPPDAQWIRQDYVEPSLLTMINTNYFKAMHLLSTIASELAISLRQHVNPNQIIIKRIRDYPVFLIIKPSHSEGPMGFMLCVPKKYASSYYNDMSVFRKLKQSGEWFYTEFVTVNVSKLNNWIKADSMYIALYAFAADYWSAELPLNLSQNVINKVHKLLSLLMMIHLHDKKSTEELISIHRYIAIEGFKMFPEICEPYNMYQDFNPHVHNRLALWVMKKLRRESIRLIKMKTYFRTYTSFKFEAFKCPFTEEILQNPYQLIQIFYYGYLCNKEESPERNTLTKLITKVITEEEKLPKNDDGSIKYDFLGHSEPKKLSDLKTHEYSPSFIIFLCDYFKKKMFSTYSIDYNIMIKDRIYNALARENLEDLATQKASSNFGPDKYKHDFKTYSRSRTSIKIAEKLKKDTFLTTDLLIEAMNYFKNNDNSMHICLFPKAQHAGTREIYVMEIYARIVQRVIEVIAATICQDFGSEMLVHPKNKYMFPDAHRKNIKRDSRPTDELIEVSISADAKRWSQRHHASKFFIMLCQFTPPEMHPFLFNALKLWEKKKIMIDCRLLNLVSDLIDKGTKVKTQEGILEKLIAFYSGSEKYHWAPGGPKSSYIQIQSGMMQGVLHYTSSLLHSLYLEWFQDFANTLLFEEMTNRIRNFNLFTYHMQSSDDSSMTIGITSPKFSVNDHLFVLRRTSMIFRLKGILSKWVGIYPSEKKEKLNTLNFMEFNSEFYVESSVYKATDKFVFASIRFSESETMIGKQEENYNLITSIPENGGSFLLASFCQVSQALLHYRTLGYATSHLFPRWLEYARIANDPSIGFHLLDECIAAGVGGVRYLVYQACKRSSYLQGKFKEMLTTYSSRPELSDQENYERKIAGEILCSALTIRATSVPLCHTKKWQAAVEELNRNSLCEWRTSIEDNPEILYRRAYDGLETYAKIMAKMHSPGVPQSFSNRNALSRVMAMGVYILSRPVVHIKEVDDIENPTLAMITNTKSLLLWSSIQFEGRLERQDYEMIFPQQEDYLNLQDRIACFSVRTSLKEQDMKRKRIRSVVSVYASEQDFFINPVKIISDTWFDKENSSYSRSTLHYHYCKLQKSIKWLKNNPIDTLKASPFTDQIKMKNYFSSINEKRRSLRLNGTPARSRQGKANLVSAMMHDVWGDFKLTGATDSTAASVATQFHQAQSALYYYMMFPKSQPNWISNDTFDKLIINTVPDVVSDPRSNRSAYQIAKAVALKLNKEELLSKIKTYQMGCFGRWLVRQHRNSQGIYYGLGVWYGIINGIATKIYCHGQDYNSLLAVHVNKELSHEEAIQYLNILTDWCHDESIKFDWSKFPPVINYIAQYSIDSNYKVICAVSSKQYVKGLGIEKTKYPLVFVNPNLVYIVSTDNIKEFYIECYSNILRIKASFTDKQPDLNVLRLIVKPPAGSSAINYDALDRSNIIEQPLRNWMCIKSLPLNFATGLLLDLLHVEKDGHLIQKYDQVDPISSFFRELLIHSLVTSGLIRGESHLREDANKDVVVDRIQFDDAMDMAFETIFTNDMDIMQEAFVDNYTVEEAVETFDDYIEMTSSESVSTVEMFSEKPEVSSRVWIGHPLLFNIIDDFLKNHLQNVKNFFKNKCAPRVHKNSIWFKICCFALKTNPLDIQLIDEQSAEDFIGYRWQMS